MTPVWDVAMRLIFHRLISIILAALIICFQPARAEIGLSDNEIVIGTLGLCSGPSGFYGREMNLGVDALVSAVNANGGIYGRNLRVIHEDDQYDVDKAIACFNDLMTKGVFAITAQVGSPTLAKYIPMCTTNKVPIIGGFSGPYFACEPVKRYFFNARPSYRDEEHAAVDHLWKLGIRKIGVIYQNDAYGSDCLVGVKEALEKRKADVVATGSYERNKNNVVEAVGTVMKAEPEAVIIAAVYKPTADILKQAHQQNWHPIFVMGTGSCIDAMMPLAAGTADGFPVSEDVPLFTDTDVKVVADFQRDLHTYFPKEKPTFTGFKGYVDALLLVEGLKRAGKNPTREKLVDAIESIKNFELGRGLKLSFSASDHWGMHNVVWVTADKGQFVPFTDWSALKAKH